MKASDFKELQDFCEKKGYQLLNESLEDNTKFFVVAKKKDEWEGVEFFNVHSYEFVYRIDLIDDRIIHSKEGPVFAKVVCEPSTETAYVEQLKAEAFKRFGEIKSGEKFNRGWYESDRSENYIGRYPSLIGRGFSYTKSNDCLTFDGIIIYEQGKWATRVPESVKVLFEHTHQRVRFFSDNKKILITYEIAAFLAEKLESYLNGEPTNPPKP